MAIDFDKIDRSVDLKGLQADVEDAKKNGGGDFPTIPAGKYEVKLDVYKRQSFDYLMGYGAAPVAEPPIKKISVKEAARCMGKSDQFVRIGLQRGLLPFGNAVPGTGACWNYYINPTKFRDYVGADQFNSFFGLTA